MLWGKPQRPRPSPWGGVDAPAQPWGKQMQNILSSFSIGLFFRLVSWKIKYKDLFSARY